jgi:hypothetical protein
MALQSTFSLVQELIEQLVKLERSVESQVQEITWHHRMNIFRKPVLNVVFYLGKKGWRP